MSQAGPCGRGTPRWSIRGERETVRDEALQVLLALERVAEWGEVAVGGRDAVQHRAARLGQAGLAEAAVARPALRASGHASQMSVAASRPQDASVTTL